MAGNKALRRAASTRDAIRLTADLPLIVDTTELITPDAAREMLKRNTRNRPINWEAVEKLSDIMKRGHWQLHAQGIILDGNGNILTGQTRLWAVVYSDTSVYMRVSKGSPPESAFVIDRGRPQSARDLSSRHTERTHSPTEASLARCVCVLRGQTKPGVDEIAAALTGKDDILKLLMKECRGIKKTKTVLMVMGAIAHLSKSTEAAATAVKRIQSMATELDVALTPYSASTCWGKGAAFGMALEKACAIVRPRTVT